MTLNEYKELRRSGRSAKSIESEYRYNRTKEIEAKNAARDPWDNMSVEEQHGLMAAVNNGLPSATEESQAAYDLYVQLMEQAKINAQKFGYKPGTEEYDNEVAALIADNWPDNQVLSFDQTKDMYNGYQTQLQQKEKEEKEHSMMPLTVGYAAGLTPEEIQAEKDRKQNGGSIFTGESIFSPGGVVDRWFGGGYGESGRNLPERIGDANQAVSQIPKPWEESYNNSLYTTNDGWRTQR